MRRARRSDRGAVTAFVAVVSIALIFVAGMAYDGGSILTAHSTARSYAAKAARAAAQEVDVDQLRTSGRVELDPAAAESAGQAYLASVGATGTVTVEGDDVTVSVTILQPMYILPLPDRRVVATETASAFTAEDQEVTP